MQEIVKQEVMSIIDKVLNTLYPSEKYIIQRRFYDDATYHTISKELHIGWGTVRARERKALRKLRHPSRSKQLRICLEYFNELAA